MPISARAPAAVAYLFLLLIAVAAIDCARTRTTRVQDPAFMGKSFSAPAVFADITDLHNRQLVEEAMVSALESHGIRARSAVQLVPPTRDYTPEERLQILRGAGVDSLVVITAAWGTTRHYVPVMGSTTTTYGSMNVYGNYATYREQSDTQYQGGYQVEKPWAKGEFVIVDLATGQKAWLGRSETRGEATAGWDDIRKSACSQVAKQMVADRILVVGPAPTVASTNPQTVASPPPFLSDAGPPSQSPPPISQTPDTTNTEPTQAFGLIDRKCQMQYANASGELKPSRSGDRMATSCMRQGKRIRCTFRGQDPTTTFDRLETRSIDFEVFADDENVTASKSTTDAGGTFLFISWNSNTFVLADLTATGSLDVIQKQCVGKVTVVK